MGLFDDNAADLSAINTYFNTTKSVTPAAEKLKNDWSAWYNKPRFYVSDLDVDEAENRRNAFNIANTKTVEEAEALKEQLGRGMTREEMKGGAKARRADSAGNYPNAKGITVASAAKGSIPKGARPTIRQGSTGEAVKAWQEVLGIERDGIFGPITAAKTKEWQRERGLVVDGIVGTATWGAAFNELNEPNPDMPFEVAKTTPVAPINSEPKKVPTGTVIPKKAIRVAKATKKPKKKNKKSIDVDKVIVASRKPATQVTRPKIKTDKPAVTAPIVKGGMLPTDFGDSFGEKITPWLAGLSVVTIASAIFYTIVSPSKSKKVKKLKK